VSDWTSWHARYEDPASPHSQRLAAVQDEDIERTAAAVPSLLATGGSVVWTRHRREPDLTPQVRAWFAAAGVAEFAFVAAPGPGWAAGAGVLQAPSTPLDGARRLFTFEPGSP
jgi:hypothetical protein